MSFLYVIQLMFQEKEPGVTNRNASFREVSDLAFQPGWLVNLLREKISGGLHRREIAVAEFMLPSEQRSISFDPNSR